MGVGCIRGAHEHLWAQEDELTFITSAIIVTGMSQWLGGVSLVREGARAAF